MELDVFFEGVGQFDLVFLNNSAADLLVDGLPRWTQVFIHQFHAGALDKRLRRRALSWAHAEPLPRLEHVKVLLVHIGVLVIFK